MFTSVSFDFDLFSGADRDRIVMRRYRRFRIAFLLWLRTIRRQTNSRSVKSPKRLI